MPNNPNKKPLGRPKKRSMSGTAVSSNPGRPRKTDLHEVSYSTLNRRAHELAGQFDIETIQLALNIAKKNSNFVDEPDSAPISIIPHSLESAFALFLENDFSKAQWDRLVNDSKQQNASIYPSYYKLDKVKEQCRPTVYSVENEMCVQVSFQVMLNLTAERIVTAVGSEWSTEDLNDLVLIVAYGFDSSGGFNNPHQKFNDAENITLKSDLSLFASTFILVGIMTSSKKILWINPTPQSIRFCRPLRIAIEKETNETIMIEKNRLDKEVEELKSHCFVLKNGKRVTVNYETYLTMIDGKCLNCVLYNTATIRCPICYLTMDNFNKECDWNAEIPVSNLTHGIANLHCEIKALEQLIKLSCRLPLVPLKWTVPKESKHIKDQEMEKIKRKLYESFYVRIGEVQHGSGTSLNGNSARKCFKDPSALAKALGIKEDLVKRLAFVVLAFKQKDGVNMAILENYCTETYKLFFNLYPWAKMNPSVHKMLRHGNDIARQFPLSLAYFAEDAAESMHKCYKKNSISHARQNSRANRLKDVFNRSVDLSDPLISTVYLEKRCKSQKEELPPEFRSLFGIGNNDTV